MLPIFEPDSIEKEEALKHYFQLIVDLINNHFAHHLPGYNCYFIVDKIIKAMVDSWFVIRWQVAIIITVASATATAEELESYLSNSKCIIETNTSATRVLGGRSLGDY